MESIIHEDTINKNICNELLELTKSYVVMKNEAPVRPIRPQCAKADAVQVPSLWYGHGGLHAHIAYWPSNTERQRVIQLLAGQTSCKLCAC